MKSFKNVRTILIAVLAIAGILFFIGLYGVLQQNNKAKVSGPQVISFCNTKIGEAKDGRIYVNYDGSTYSFEADTSAPDLFSADNLTLFGGCGPGGSMPQDWNERITYKRLIMHFPRKDNLTKVTYACDNPLAGKIFSNCVTDGQDKISQYEFGSGYIDKINGLADQYGSSYRWEKIMISKMAGKNMIFEGVMISPSAQSRLFGTDTCGDNPEYLCQTAEQKNNASYNYIDPQSLFGLYKTLRVANMVPDMNIYENTVTYSTDEQWYKTLFAMKDSMLQKLQSPEYLLYLIKLDGNASAEKDWNNIVNSFRVES